jgi:hypothetical protein
MLLFRNWYFVLALCLFVFLLGNFNSGFNQKSSYSGLSLVTKESITKQDTSREFRKRNALTAAEPDTNFTYEKYAGFLKKVSDTSKYIVLPINEFRTTFNSNKIVIGLRHDVDNDLNKALEFSRTESDLGFRSTYYILHTAPYYLVNTNNMAIHSANIFPTLNTMQNIRHFEIGWHNDLVTLQAVYNIDPVAFLKNELAWLRANGINIYGSASHGSPYCYTYKYLNYYFFEECTYPVVGQFVNNINLTIGGKTVPMKKGKFSDFNLEYEAYFLNNNKYFSDASITNGTRWNIGMLNLDQLHAGDRVIILLHPIHWHKASDLARIESFTIYGQKSSKIDEATSTITVEMPNGTNLKSLLAEFTISPGAYAKIASQIQESGVTYNNFLTPLTYTIYAENRAITKIWTIRVYTPQSSECEFKSFEISGLTKAVNINSILKTIRVELIDGSLLTQLPVKFELSPGASAWINNVEQFSNAGYIDITKPIQYKIIAEDGLSTSTWTVTVVHALTPVEEIESPQKSITVYPNPTSGIIFMQFLNSEITPLRINIYNTLGEMVFTNLISKTGNFTVEANLTKLPAGIYIIKYSGSEKPVIIIKH